MSVQTEWKNSDKIEVYNTPKNCCCDEFCGARANYFVNVKIGNQDIQLIFCKKHFEEFEQQFFSINQNRNKSKTETSHKNTQ